LGIELLIDNCILKYFSSKKAYEDGEYQNRNEYDRIHRDLTDELQQARLELDTLKNSKPQYDQVEEQNQM